MYSLITFCVAAVFVFLSYRFFKNEPAEKFIFYLKALAVTFCVIGISRYFLLDSFPETVKTAGEDLSQSFSRWFYYMGYAVVPMSIFFESRLFRNLATCIFLPAAVFSTVLFDETMGYFLSDGGNGFALVPWLRYAFYILELVLAIALPILMQICYRHGFDIKSKTDLKHMLIALPAILYQMIPVYIPQSFFGYTDISWASFSPFHICWILLMAAEIVVLILYFRNRSYEDKYKLCVFLTIAQLFNTMSAFLRGFRLTRIPIQLCSIAAIFYLIAIVFKKKKLFDFCFLVNIVGALIAILLAAFSEGAFSFWNMHYIYEHTFALIVPIVAAALGVFPRVSRESLKFSWIMFTAYFVFCLCVGTVLNGFSDSIGYTVNYFYMLDVSVAVEYVPFASFTGNWVISMGRFTLYPILVLVVYSAYIVFCGAFFGIVELSYAIRDGRLKISKIYRNRKLKH